jgi:NitT/TauT family transport system ATP-binding protein
MFLQIDRLSKHFSTPTGNLVVLDNIDLTIQAGEFVCAVGASGSGKSTLLRQIAGLDRPTSGEIRIAGNRVTSPGPDRGMVFQHYSLYPWLNVQENTEFGLKLQGVPKRERRERASKYLQIVGLENFAKALPKELSGGMKQRVAIARSLVSEPQMLLMDEPFGALDVHTKETMYQFMLDLWERTKVTVFMITHDVKEAVYLSDRIFVLGSRPGRVKKELKIDLPDRIDTQIDRHHSFHAYCDEIVESMRQTQQREAI